MSKKLICLASALVLMGSALANAGVGPVGWWKLDETTGTTAADSSRSKNHGTLMGEPTPTVGQIDGGILCDGTNDYVALPIGSVISTLGSSTFTVWANYTRSGGNWQRIFDIGTGETVNMFLTPAIGGSNSGVMRFAITIGGSGAESQLSAPGQLATGWHHIAVVVDAEAMDMEMYLDGVSIVTAATARLPKDLGNTTQNWLGRSEYGADAYYSGSLDEFRIYDRALTPAEITDVMGGGLTGITAGVPNPANAATDVPRDDDLSWAPGELAATHNVYLGTTLNNVRNASVSNPLGVLVSQGQDANSFDPGRLELGRTYYWRVDEVNAAPDATVFKGAVWSFTVEPFSYPIAGVVATASGSSKANMGPEKIVDG
ncbi:MAG: LamG domain-containing protein, partial [Phycisphaerales bacterium]